MTDDSKRDILDVTTANVPPENQPQKVERPMVSPQEGAYFLDKFLDQQNEPESTESMNDSNVESQGVQTDPTNSQTPSSPEELQGNIVSALQEIYDPEIPVNIYELGLIYSVDVAKDYSAHVTMTLTTPHCPVAESMPGEVELKVNSVNGVNGVRVDLVWEPPWEMSMMSDEARLELGLL